MRRGGWALKGKINKKINRCKHKWAGLCKDSWGGRMVTCSYLRTLINSAICIWGLGETKKLYTLQWSGERKTSKSLTPSLIQQKWWDFRGQALKGISLPRTLPWESSHQAVRSEVQPPEGTEWRCWTDGPSWAPTSRVQHRVGSHVVSKPPIYSSTYAQLLGSHPESPPSSDPRHRGVKKSHPSVSYCNS